MFLDALNQIIEKKCMKENWKIKGMIIYLKKTFAFTDHCKRRRDCRIKKIKWKIATKAI